MIEPLERSSLFGVNAGDVYGIQIVNHAFDLSLTAKVTGFDVEVINPKEFSSAVHIIPEDLEPKIAVHFRELEPPYYRYRFPLETVLNGEQQNPNSTVRMALITSANK